MNAIIRQILNTTLRRHRNSCPPEITDLVFQIIEINYRTDYNRAVRRSSKRAINTSGGRFIKDHWNLQNIGRTKASLSSLIKTYTRHSN
jgi:hypothetical protein